MIIDMHTHAGRPRRTGDVDRTVLATMRPGGVAAVAPDASTAYEPGWDPSDDAAITPTNANLDCNVPATFMTSALTESTWTPTVGAKEGTSCRRSERRGHRILG